MEYIISPSGQHYGNVSSAGSVCVCSHSDPCPSHSKSVHSARNRITLSCIVSATASSSQSHGGVFALPSISRTLGNQFEACPSCRQPHAAHATRRTQTNRNRQKPEGENQNQDACVHVLLYVFNRFSHSQPPQRTYTYCIPSVSLSLYTTLD